MPTLEQKRRWLAVTKALLHMPKLPDTDHSVVLAMAELRAHAAAQVAARDAARRARRVEYNGRVPPMWQVTEDQHTWLSTLDLDALCEPIFEALGRPQLGEANPVWLGKGRRRIDAAIAAWEADRNGDIDRYMAARSAETPPGLDDPRDLLVDTCRSEWSEVKRRLLEDPGTRNPVMMWEMVKFRKAEVDAAIRWAADQQGCDDVLAKSVGSQNLTSDYDLTLSTTSGSGAEIDVIAAFNQRISSRFRKQPGIAFDTNLYAKDFLGVTGNVLGDGDSDPGDVDETLELLASDRSDQDIAALTKMRQYMSQDEWDDYLEELVAAGGLSKTEVQQITAQLEEADALFIHKCRQEVEAFLAAYTDEVMDGIRRGVPRIEQLKREREARLRRHQPDDLRLEQEVLPELSKELGHLDEDLMLAVRNGVYLQRMRTVRTIQGHVQALVEALQRAATDDADLDVDALPIEGGDKAALSRMEPEAQGAWLAEHIDALREQARKLIGEANFFAAEAYLSEGPLQHIVNGRQSDNPAVFARLKPEHFLESINEQTGDFFKDVQHYGDAPEGVALYQCSKYLARALEGVAKLSGKVAFKEIEASLPTLGRWGRSAAALQALIEERLLPIRGAKAEWSSATTEDKAQAARDACDAIFGYTGATIAGLKADVRALSIELNKAVRVAIKMRPSRKELTRTLTHHELVDIDGDLM